MAVEHDPQFEALLTYLKEQRGFDFTGYKRASLARRVQRRMDLTGVESFSAYRERLEMQPAEFIELFNTVLINVTGFFRDADAWEYLRTTVVPQLLEANDGPVRLWSAGCATGQEAYSLAMTFADVLGLDEYRRRVKVYATDVDEDALTTARTAVYTEREMQGVEEHHREAYFERLGDGFAVRKELRRTVIFGRNDLVQDAPISHVDLLACRNTLMYFNAETQATMVRRLHFALEPHGVVFLGKAEMLLSHPELFQPVELKRRFFRRVMPSGLGRRAEPAGGAARLAVAQEDLVTRLKEQALLASPAAQVIVTADGEVAACNRRAESLFGLGARDVGRPLKDLELSYRPVELRSSIGEALASRQTVWVHGVPWTRPTAEPLSLDVQVVPLFGGAGEAIGATVVFHDMTRYRTLKAELDDANRQLELASEELQSTVEELETTNEELQSTVEELETTNEELQSTNEELETMNEELQSINDELNATNEELRVRTMEVGSLNRFLEAVLASIRAGVAVVDLSLNVLAWNSRAEDLWGVREEEAVGRPFADLDIGLPLTPLRQLLRAQLLDGDGTPDSVRLSAVNRRGKPVEVEVSASPLRHDGADVMGAILVMTVVG